MPSPNPHGAVFETALLKHLQSAGIDAVKPRQTKALDIGDIHVEDDIVVQAKHWANIAAALREGTADAQDQARRAHRPIGVSVIKKPRAPIADAYVSMPLHVFVSLLRSRQSPSEK